MTFNKMSELSHHIRTAHGYAINLCHGRYSEDVLGAARLGLAEALDSYIPGNDFKVWLRVCVRREIVKYFRGRLGRSGFTPEFQEFFDNDIRMSCNGTEKTVIAKDVLYKFIASLPQKQRQRLLMRFKQDATNEEIADTDGVKKETVEQTFNSIYRRAKRFLTDNPVRCGGW